MNVCMNCIILLDTNKLKSVFVVCIPIIVLADSPVRIVQIFLQIRLDVATQLPSPQLYQISVAALPISLQNHSSITKPLTFINYCN